MLPEICKIEERMADVQNEIINIENGEEPRYSDHSGAPGRFDHAAWLVAENRELMQERDRFQEMMWNAR